MPELRITPNRGFNTDIGESLLPPEFVSSGRDFEVIDGSLRAVRGERKLFDISIKPLYHTAYVDTLSAQWVIVSDGVSVYAYTIDGQEEDITPSVGDMNDSIVTFADLNGVLVVNGDRAGLFYWPGSGDALVQWPGPGDAERTWSSGAGAPDDGDGEDGDYYQDTDDGTWYTKVSGSWTTTTGGVEYGWRWDEDWRCKAVDTYRYYVLALGMEEDGTEYFQKVRWSTAAEEGAIPIQWQILASNEAGSDLLGETPGKIVGGRKIRDAYYVIKEDAIYALSWIGGSFVMQLTRLQGTIGTNAPFAFAELNGQLVVCTSTDLLLFDGTQQVSISDSSIRRALFEAIDESYWDRTRLYYHPPSGVLFVAVVRPGNNALSDALMFNSQERAWGHKRLTVGYGFDTAFVSVAAGGVTYVGVDDDGTLDVCGWDDNGTPINCSTWDFTDWVAPTSEQDIYYSETPVSELNIPGNKGLYQPSVPDTLLYESDHDGNYWVSLLALTHTNSDGTPKNCYVERLGLPIEGVRGLALINEAWVEAEGAEFNLSLGIQDVVGGPVRWDSPILVDPASDTPLDPVLTGRYLCWRVESEVIDPWVLHALTVNWEPAGGY